MVFLRALLVYGLLAGFYLVALYVAVLCGVASIGLLIFGIRRPSEVPILVYPVAVATFYVFVSIVLGVLAARVPPRAPMLGAVRVSAKDQPRLWETVTGLSRRMGAPVPMELWLTAEPNASVSEEAWPLRTRLGVRRLYVGVPLLVGLSTDQLRAVLCHELGHYAGMHTPIGAIAYRGSLALASVRERVRRSHRRGMPVLYWYQWVVLLYLWAYERLYDRLTFAIRRRQEVEADLAAARVVGRNVMADALRSGQVVVAAWNDFNSRFLTPMCNAGHVPSNPFEAFTEMLADPAYQEVLARYRECPPERPRFRLDTHPPLNQRLSKLARAAAKSVDLDRSPAVEILDEPQRLFTRVWAANIHTDPNLPTREWLNLLGSCQAAEAVRDLKQALEQVRGTQLPHLTVDATLNLLATGDRERLSEQLGHLRGATTAALPGQSSDPLCDTVYALVGHALVGAGRARWAVDWVNQGSAWRSTSVTPTEIRKLVGAAVLTPEVRGNRLGLAKPTAAGQLRRRLSRLGAEVTTPLRIEPLDRVTASQPTRGRIRALNGLTFAASILLGVAAGVSAVSAVGYFRLASARADAQASPFGPSEAALASFDKAADFVRVMLLTESVTVFVTGIVFIIWHYSYARNAETLRGPLGLGASWAITGWCIILATSTPPFVQVEIWVPFASIIPLVALALPFVQLNQSARASDPNPPADAGWQRSRAPTTLKVWTVACFTAATYVFGSHRVAGGSPDSPESPAHDLVLATRGAGLGMLLFVVAGIAGIVMVRDLTRRQQQAIPNAHRPAA
jgi:Zn-dependent protease with chaperone function